MRPFQLPNPIRRLPAMLAALLLLLAAATPSSGQGRYDEWHFGYGRSIRFGPSGPKVVNDSRISTPEGSASICDPATGGLLFYTDGVTVWSREGKPMPNGTGLAGHVSATQAAMIVPAPGSPSIYYIFTTDAVHEIDPPNGFAYSVVDMSRNGGLGEVTTKNVFLLNDVSEKQTAVAACGGNDYTWVITHGLNGNQFHAYLVTAAGVSSEAVISSVGTPLGGRIVEEYGSSEGCMKASPDGTMLAMVCIDGLTEIYRFDRSTGRVYDPITLTPKSTGYAAYGVSFSPDDSRLYVAAYGRLDQYTVSAWDRAAVAASRVRIGDWSGSTLQLGPDGRIYGGALIPGWLGAISRPNDAGTACGAMQQFLFVGGEGAWGLPDNIDAWGADAGCGVLARVAPQGGTICEGSTVTFDGSASLGDRFRWTFPGGVPSASSEMMPAVSFPVPGQRTIRLIVRRGPLYDTTEMLVDVAAAPEVDAGPSRTICIGESTRLVAESNGGVGVPAFHWFPATALTCTDCRNPEAAPTTTTTYHVRVTDARGCSRVDSVTIVVQARPAIRVRVERSLNGSPGKQLVVPVILDGGLDEIPVHSMTVRLGYDPRLMRLADLTPTTLASLTARTLLSGWRIDVERAIPGEVRVTATAPTPASRIVGSGTLMKLPFMTFIGLTDPTDTTAVSELPFTATVEADRCVDVAPSPGRVQFQLCGLEFRFMEMGLGKYSLDPNTPNPFNPSTDIRFHLALDGETRVEILDAIGHRVATLLDNYLPAGTHRMSWDATTYSSGIYYCRVTSGAWSETRTMMLVK